MSARDSFDDSTEADTGVDRTALRSQVDSLIKTVATLQSELKASTQTISDLREELNSQSRASVTPEAVRDLVRAEVEKQSQLLAKDLAVQYGRIETSLVERIENGETEQKERLDRLEGNTTALERHFGSLNERIVALERTGSADTLASAVTSIMDDAPPTQTLISFSSPAISHIAATRRPATRTNGETPATPGRLGLPAHVVALSSSASASRRTPRAALAAAQPASIVPVLATGSVDKHGGAGDVPNPTEQVDSPPVAAHQTPDASRSGFFTAPSTAARPITAQSDSHVRKRLRASSGTGTRTAANEDSIAVYDDEDDDSRSREYTVRTKTGSSPTVVMTRDPAFFTSRPVSPSARPSAGVPRSRASSVASRASATSDHVASQESAATNSGRKSMPMSSLPFPLVSPYGNTGRPSSRPSSVATAGSSTPHTTKTGFGNFFSGLDSANTMTEAGRRVSMFSNRALLPTSAKKGLPAPPPPTPPAHRTLFGTEFTGHRFGDAGADIDDDADNDSASLRWGAFAQ